MSMPRSVILLISSLGLLALLYACTTPQVTKTVEPESATVEIDMAVHFLTPSGEDVVILPGAYEVKSETGGIRLVAEEGTSSESLLIEATPTDHEETVTNPMAVTLSDKNNEQVITLLLPNGKGWAAWGSYSGVHSRAGQRPRLDHTQIKSRLKIKNELRTRLAQLTLSSASVTYKGSRRPHHGTKSKNTWKLPINDTINSGSFTFAWRGYWEKSSLQPSLIPNRIPEIQDIVKKKHCCITLTINGKEAKLNRVSFGRGGTLQTRVMLTKARADTWPKTVKLTLIKGKNRWESPATKIFANTISYYTSVLHPIFSHERCTTCHMLGDREAIVAMHNDRLGVGNYPDVEDARPHNPTFCGSCHSIPPGSNPNNLDLSNEWFSPDSVQGINWKGWSANRVCKKVTGPFTDKDGNAGPPVDLNHHFHDDPRILWAVSSGWVPFNRPDLAVPMKNNVQSWLSKVDPWVAAGAPCPSKSKFFRRPQRAAAGKFFPRR